MNIYTNTEGNGPNLVLLHGWGFPSDLMDPLIKNLAQDHRVTTIDLPGYARSKELDKTLDKNYNLENVVEAILKVLPDKAIYVGWSLGGLLAIKIALLNPERVSKLITITSTPCFVQREDWPGVEPSIFNKFVDGISKHTKIALQKFALLVIENELQQRTKYQEIKEELFAYGIPHLSALLGGLNILKTTDLRKAIQNISCPTKFIFSERDVLIPLEIAERIKPLAPHIKVVVLSNAGHLACLLQYNKIADEIRKC